MATIYKLYNEQDCYVGSTIQKLYKRLATHKNKKDCKSRVILEKGEYKMEMLEEVSLEDRLPREQYWIDELSTLKQSKAYTENPVEHRREYMAEYRGVNRERICEIKKKYREANKERLKEKASVDCECECGTKYMLRSKARHLRSKKHLAFTKVPE